MQIMQSGDLPICSDMELIAQHLPLDNTQLLELGCGAAFTTRRLAEAFPNMRLLATEVDRIQHEKNLLIDDLPQVTFAYGGAQEIAADDASIDAVIMLKSLHHVPLELMETAFTEIHRVLKPSGLLYISEPVYAGAFNDILRLFNDEKAVREAAFSAIQTAVANNLFTLKQEIHCNSISRFEGFEAFDQRILGATHSNFAIDTELREEIRSRFVPHIAENGVAEFLNPLRVDILQRR